MKEATLEQIRDSGGRKVGEPQVKSVASANAETERFGSKNHATQYWK